MPDRDWDFVSLDLEVAIDLEDRSLSGLATHRLRPLGVATEVVLHAADLDILSVAVDGAPVERWRSHGDRLVIPLAVGPGERSVEVRYTARPTAGMYFRGPPGDAVREVWTQGEDEENRHWFPGWDYPNDRFTVRTAVTVPDGLLAVANGVLVSKAPGEAAGTTRWAYAIETPIVNYLVAIAAGEYRVVVEPGAPTLEHVVPMKTSDATVERSTRETRSMLDYLGGLLGTPYPWTVYRQVYVQRFLYGGMENATTTVLSDDYLLRDPILDRYNADFVLAHEIAHQWFGDLVGVYGWRDLWLNEGFATYYGNRWREERYGAAAAAAEVADWMSRGMRDAAPLAPRGWSKEGDRSPVQVYTRGAAVLHAVEIAIGREAFDHAIGAYVAENSGKLVETDTLRRALEETSGMHLGWLFDRWVHRAVFPTVTASWAWEAGELRVTLAHPDAEPLGAPVWVAIGGPTPRRARVWLRAATVELVVPLAEPPAYVAVDPERGVLARWEVDQPPAAWIAQLGAEAPLVRLAAIAALERGKSTPAVEAALGDLARDGAEDAALRSAALAALGQLGSAAVAEELIDAEDPRIRRAALRALGEVAPEPARAGEVRDRLDDPSPDVAREAWGALERLDPAAALIEARRRSSGRSHRGSAHGPALGVLGRLGSAADLPRVTQHVDARETRDARHAAARAGAELVEREHVASPDLAQRLVAMLDDPDRLDAGLAVALLGRIGTQREVPALRAFAATRSLRRPDLAGAAGEAVAAIAGREDSGPKTAEDLAELERIRTALAALEERIKTLEEFR